MAKKHLSPVQSLRKKLKASLHEVKELQSSIKNKAHELNVWKSECDKCTSTIMEMNATFICRLSALSPENAQEAMRAYEAYLIRQSPSTRDEVAAVLTVANHYKQAADSLFYQLQGKSSWERSKTKDLTDLRVLVAHQAREIASLNHQLTTTKG